MFKNIIGTAGSRILITLLSFLVVVVNSKYIGAAGVGTIGLIILGISINLLISNFVGGGALIYLVPRQDVFLLLFPAYLWSLIISVAGSLVLSFFKLIPQEYTFHVMFLSLLQALSAINLSILLGKEKIKLYNTLSVIESVVRIGGLLCFIFWFHTISPLAFVYALYFSLGLLLLLSLLPVIPYLKFSNLSKLKTVIKEMLKFGSYVQVASIFQLFNYRLSYYIIENVLGRASLGIYSVGVQVSESVWLVGKSVAQVQYFRISNSEDEAYAKRITLAFLKFTTVITVIAVAALMLIPNEIYVFVFHKEFSQLGIVISTMSVGIVSIAVSMMFSHYFAGRGKPYHNTISSGVGFVFTLGFGLWLIPRFGLAGAGITASVAYTVAMIYQLIVFIKMAKVKMGEFLITEKDFHLFVTETKSLFLKNKPQTRIS